MRDGPGLDDPPRLRRDPGPAPPTEVDRANVTSQARQQKPCIDDPVESPTLPASLPCPFCGGEDASQFSPFGGQVSTSQYYCNECRSVFESIRWR
ncbi:MAG: hypothetical protein J4G03_06660 [Gemmatimonadetes bacterium]|nr:hypothetical protein [Gemmatimonadota bacterium]